MRRVVLLLAAVSIAAPARAADTESVCTAWAKAVGTEAPEVGDVAELVTRMPPDAGFSLIPAGRADIAQLARDGVPAAVLRPPGGGTLRVYNIPLARADRRDVVVERETGVLQCRAYAWFLRDDGGVLGAISGPTLDNAESDDGLCRVGGQSLAFLRHPAEPTALIAVMDQRPLDAALDDPPYTGSYDIFRILPEGQADHLCHQVIPAR